jgi:hypothetical protein
MDMLSSLFASDLFYGSSLGYCILLLSSQYLFCNMLKAFDALFEQVGGFDGLYVKMVTSGIPTTIQYMSVPFKEIGLRMQILFLLRICYNVLNFIWSKMISGPVTWYLGKLNHILEVVMVRVGFPIIEFIIPQQVSSIKTFIVLCRLVFVLCLKVL